MLEKMDSSDTANLANGLNSTLNKGASDMANADLSDPK